MHQQIIILMVFFVSSMALNFNLLGNKQFCMRFQGGNIYALEYVISGNQDQNVKCKIKQSGNVILTKEQVSQYQYINDYKSQDPIQICFESTDGVQKQISFDFYPVNDPLRKIIDKNDVTIVQQALTQSYKQMSEISRNQEFQIERDDIHKLNLEQSENKIKWAGIVKIVFLLASALIQLYIMKGFFTNSNPYQPVQMM